MGRSYYDKDLKLLWGLAAARCSYPDCRLACVVPSTDLDDSALIGKIAHIVAHGKKGPRADTTYPDNLRDTYENLILLCSNHHDLVDGQPNTFTVHDLRQWKADHETWVRVSLAREMPVVGFAELEIVTKAILSRPSKPNKSFRLLDPEQKMQRNQMTSKVRPYLEFGMSKAREVEKFVEQMAMIDPIFPERLRAGFIGKYIYLYSKDLRGDSLFEGLREFANGGSFDFLRQAAGLAVLTYLFEKCEVFET
jgi:hypothetical protein